MRDLSRRDLFRGLGAIGLGGMLLPGLKSAAPIRNENRLYKLGKQPAREHVGLKLRDYIVPNKLPVPSGDFGHQGLVKSWGMLGNGQAPDNPPTAPEGAGDCAIAGPFHAIQLWCTESGHPFNVNTACTLLAYAEITGYDPSQYNPATGDNPTDRGANVQDVAEQWRTLGLTDASGNVHKIDGYLQIETGNIEELWAAMFLLDGAGIGVEMPSQWQQAFMAGQPWDAVAYPEIEGGHYIFACGRVNGNINVVTWGANQILTPAGYEELSDEP